MNYSCLGSMVYDLSAPGIIADYYLRMGSSMLFVSLGFVVDLRVFYFNSVLFFKQIYFMSPLMQQIYDKINLSYGMVIKKCPSPSFSPRGFCLN